MRLATPHLIQLLLLADGARWWYLAERVGNAVRLEPINPRPIG